MRCLDSNPEAEKENESANLQAAKKVLLVVREWHQIRG